MTTHYDRLLLDQSKDQIWMVDHQLHLVYANKAFLNLVKEVTGVEKQLHTNVLYEELGKDAVENWKSYYQRALSGESFTVEDHYYHPGKNEIQHAHISFSPIKDEEGNIQCVACRNMDVTALIREKYQASQLMDASLDIFCTINEDGNFVYVSEASTALWGYTPEELINTQYIKLVVEEDIIKSNNIADAIVAGEEVKSFVNRYQRKDGGIAYNLWSARWDDEAKLMYCVARDAKEKIEQENLLLKSEKRFRALIENGADAIVIIGADGKPNYVSSTIHKLLGYTEEEALELNLFEIIHPDDLDGVVNKMSEVMQSPGVPIQGQTSRTRHKDGSWRWLEATIVNMLHDPDINGIVDNFRDVTARKEEEHRLRLLESVVTNTHDAVLITEAEPLSEPGPKIIYVNEAFTKMTGYTAAEVIGKTPRILQGPKSNNEALTILGNALRNWQSYEITTINYKKNGEEFWVNFTVTPVADETGWYTHWIAIERDVTVQKNAEIEKNLLADIATCFREEELNKAGKALCEVIRDFADFDLVELWCPNLEQTHLLRIDDQSSIDQFQEEKNTIYKVAKGEGLKGRVWEKGEQLLWDSEKISKYFLRNKKASNAGLTHLLGVPLTHQNQITGVLVIGTTTGDASLQKSSGLLKNLEAFIGSEIHRKRLEDDLTKLYDTVPEILCVTDFKGRNLKMNPAGFDLLGYTEDEILMKPFEMFVHPDDKYTSFQELEKLKKGISTIQFENRCITKAGNVIWLSWNCNVSFQEGLIYAAAKNITEEKKLRSLNRQANSMAKIGSWEVDVEKGSIFWSEMVHQMHETDPNTFVPDLETAINFYHEDYREMVGESVERAIQTGGSFDFEAIIVTRNHHQRWVRAIGSTEVVNGVTRRIFGSLQDIHDRKIEERQKNRLLTTLENSLNEIYVFDAKTLKFSYVNKGALNNLGYSREEIKQLTPLDLKPEFTADSFHKLISPLLNNEKERILFTTSHKRKNGNLYPVEVHLQLMLEENEKLLLAIILDITERKKSEQKILEANERFEKVTEATNDAIWDWDILNDTFYRSQNIHNLFGKETLTALTRKDFWTDSFHPDDRKAIKTSISNALKDHQTDRWEMKYRILHKNGNTVYVVDRGLIIRDRSGKAVRMIGAMTDITELISANIELTRQAEFINTMTDSQLAAMVACNAEGEVILFNKTAKDWHGVDVMNVAQDKWAENYDLYHKDGINLLEKSEIPLVRAFNGEQVQNEEIIIKRKNRKPRIVVCNGASFFDNEGQKLGAVVVMTDVTERKRSEQQLLDINQKLETQTKELERSNEELEQFAFISSHDLQEPLRMISSFMDQLDRKYASQLDDKARQYIHFAKDGAKRMKQIILDLLLYSRVNRPNELQESVNLNMVVSDFLLLRRKLIIEKKAAIHFDQLPVLKTYKAPITQLFHCLLDNALKYTKEDVPPVITIESVDKGKIWEFAIKDNGKGIDKKFYNKIFIIFQRLNERKEFDGTGIGLSIAKRAVEFLGGKIWVESVIDEGSVFYFTIPKK